MIEGIVLLFVFFGPLVIGWTTIDDYLLKKGNYSLYERTAECREPKRLAACIILLLLIPGYLIYSTLTKPIPNGDYFINVKYSVHDFSEVYDEAEDIYYEKEISYEGTAPAKISIDNQVDYEDNGEDYFGLPITKVYHSSNINLISIRLDCFDNEEFYPNITIDGSGNYDFEIEYDDMTCTVKIEVGEVSDNTLGYTMEDRFNDIPVQRIVEYSILMLLDIIGIIGYFKAVEIEKKEKSLHYENYPQFVK